MALTKVLNVVDFGLEDSTVEVDKVLSVIDIVLWVTALLEVLTSLDDLVVETGKPESRALMRVGLTPSSLVKGFDSGCLSNALLIC